jgi:hypothetical protein
MIIKDLHQPYIESSKTNVLATLRRLGWTPPSEDLRFQEKWSTFRNLATINERKSKCL